MPTRDLHHMSFIVRKLYTTSAMGKRRGSKSSRAIAELKNELIALTPSEETLDPHFLSIRSQLFHALHGGAHDAVKRNTQGADALLIWYLRAVQAIKAGADASVIPKEEVLTDEVFNWAKKRLSFSHTPQANAGLALLRRVIHLFNVLDANRGAELCGSWASRMFQSQMNKKEHFQIIELLAKEGSDVSQRLRVSHPHFIETLLSSLDSGATANAASKCLAVILQNLQQSSSETDFVSYWAESVITGLQNPKLAPNITQHLLPLLLRLTPDSVDILIKNHISSSQPVVLLSVLNVSQKLAKSKDPVDSGLLTETELYELLVSDTENIRLSALQLVVSTIKTSREPSEHIHKMLSDERVLDGFVEDSRSPETRDAFSSTIRKAIISLKDCYIHNLASSPERTKSTLTLLKDNFFLWISPASSYMLLLIAFDFFEVLVEEEFDGITRKAKNQGLRQAVFEIYDDEFILKLLHFSTNNYEDIRRKARKLLERSPRSLPFDVQDAVSQDHFDNAFKALESVQGRKSDENVNLLMLYASYYYREPKLFTDFLSLAQDKLNNLGATSPHGYYSFFANILRTYPGFINEHLDSSTEWIISLLSSCQKLWDKYKANTTFETLEDSEGMEASSWRAVRESALLLDTIIQLNSQYDILTKKDLLSACELARDQLGNITHRGVLSSVFNTYVSGCVACLNDEELATWPDRWLDESLELVKGKTQFVSRRSGGLPFLITGVLNAYTKKSNYQKLSYVMDELTSHTKAPLKEEERAKSGFPQVHAFNCIKHLYLDSVLFPYARRYLEDVLELSLRSINSPEWSIKNAALMLFSAIINRVFGTNMVNNQPSRMDLPELSDMFPSFEGTVREFLMDFDVSVESALCILTILERTEMDVTDEYGLLLVNLVQDYYLEHKKWKLRKMAARVVPNMLDLMETDELFNIFPEEAQWYNANNFHGFLLLLKDISSRSNYDDRVEVLSHAFDMQLKGQRWQLFSAFLDLIPVIPKYMATQLGNFFCHHIVQRSKYPHGAKHTTLAKLLRLLHAYHESEGELGNAEDVILLGLSDEAYELQQLAIECCRSHQKLSPDLIQALQDVITNPLTWTLVRVDAMKLLVDNGIFTQVNVPDIEWSYELQVLCLVSQEKPGARELQKVLHPSQEEDSRLLCVDSISRAISNAENSVYVDDLTVLLLLSCRGESRAVRRRAADTLCQIFNLSKDYSTSYIFKKAIEAHGPFDVLEGSILHDFLYLYKEDFEEFAKKEEFDLDRDDLYMNEVRLHRELSSVVSKDNLQHDTDSLLQLIEQKSCLKAWEYDYLFDTGLNKFMHLAGEDDKKRVKAALDSIKYSYTDSV